MEQQAQFQEQDIFQVVVAEFQVEQVQMEVGVLLIKVELMQLQIVVGAEGEHLLTQEQHLQVVLD
jgi:hypothetical protein